jgi:formamidopyrimidine-DNA glycosylase
MPELPEVETVCQGLARVLIGARFTDAEQHRGDLRTALPKNLPARLKGRRIEAIARRAKYILVTLDKDEVLLLHLGMSGRLVISHDDKKPPGKHDHLVFHFDNGATVRFNDPRRFGMCDLVAAQDIARHKLLRRLGVEPLGPGLTVDWLAAKFKGKKISIKNALMDQRIIAGIGNIYACEALFYAGINPKRKAGTCTKAQIGKLVPAINKVLNSAVASGGSTLRNYVQSNGDLGGFQHHFAVYDHEDQPCPNCRCDFKKTGGIRRIVQGGRSTFYCPVKQA